jgi:hypothetical protein
MKTNTQGFMKNTVIIVFAAVTACTASCKKDASSTTGSTTTGRTVTEADAANAVTASVTPQTSGMVTQVSDATVMASVPVYTCGQSFDSTIAGASAAGATVTYAFNLTWGWQFSCANPASFTGSFKGSSSYSTQYISSSDSSKGNFVLTGITPTAKNYTLNASYTRNGSCQSGIGNKNSFTSTIAITSTNILVSKTTREIVSGTATATITGASSSGKSFSFAGTITFNGNKTATLAITGGGTYQINW